mgnify:CR=1 FL=1
MIKWKKFKVTKLPAQKSPDRFASMDSAALADKAARRKFGEGADFLTKQGMQTKSIREVAVKDYARKVKERVFTSTLNKELKASRLRTATGIKGKKLKVKTPTAPTFKQQKVGIFKGSGLPKSKPSLKKAKDKGALKSYNLAKDKGNKAFTRIVERYTGKAASDVTRFKTVKPRKINESALAAMGLEDRTVSGMKGRTYKTFKNTARGDFNIFKPKKRK